MEIDMKESLRLKKMLNEILADKTGQSVSKISKDVERDYWLSAHEAVKYGLIDKVISKKLAELEQRAGSSPGVFIIEGGTIKSAGKEYTQAEYEAIVKDKRVVTIIDDIKEVLNEQEDRESS